MEKSWQYFDRPWKETFLDAFCKERTDPCSLVWTVARLGNLEVSSSPLLQKGREQCTSKTDHQGHEPQCIHPNCIVRWGEWRWRNGQGFGHIWVNRSLINVGEVEIGCVLWVLSNVLDRH